MKKKVLISTGGSGGHVIPALIFHEHLKDNFDVCLSSDRRGMQYLKREKYKVKIINTPKFTKNFFLLPFKIFLILYLTLKSLFFLKKEKIDILISTGGYMSLPLCLASKILKIKIFLFEPNMVIGKANRLFLSFCKKIICYSDTIINFPKKFQKKIVLIKSLLRKEFYSIKSRDQIGKEINLLIIGGSQGAELFDVAIKDTVIKLSKRYDLKVFQQISIKNYENLKNFYSDNQIKNELFDFNENIFDFMTKVNLCITRAGASTLAELTFLNIPYLAIPLPHAKDNHQLENALFYKKLGCNWVLSQNELNEISLTGKIIKMIDNKEEYLEKKKI